MAWTSSLLTQNGNSTVVWTTTGSALTTHDNIVVGVASGHSGVRLKYVTAYRDPTKYRTTVQVVGQGAVAYRLYAEAMD